MKRKHCELIKAWAEGASIQRKGIDGVWIGEVVPTWRPSDEYRIKPEQDRYIVMAALIFNVNVDDVTHGQRQAAKAAAHFALYYTSDEPKT